MAEITDSELREKVLTILAENTNTIEGTNKVPKMADGEIDLTVTLPALKFSDETFRTPEGFRYVPMETFMKPLNDAREQIDQAIEDANAATGRTTEAINNANDAAERTTTAITGANAATESANAATQNANEAAEAANTSRQQIEANEQTRQSNESTRQNQEAARRVNENARISNEATRQTQESARESLASSDHSRAEQDHTTADADHTQASADHTASVTATNEASNVDANLDGMTVTIIDRHGASKSVNLSFDFYAAYPSVAAMQADIANIPVCSLLSIATTDKTNPENARIYQKRSDGTLIYLGDLDQASAEAWANWLENYKPDIIKATNDANAAVATAEATNQSITNAENLRVTAEQGRVSAENARVQSEDARVSAENQRQSNEQTRTNTFTTNEASRQSTFESNETQRQSDFDSSQTSRNTTWTDWFSDSIATGVRHIWNTWFGTTTDEWNTLKEDVVAKTNAANAAAQNANIKAAEAEKVNATLNGTTLTVTNRAGQSTSVDTKGEKGDKGDGLNWDTMTEEDKQALINSTAEKVKEDVIYASVETCEDIIDELTNNMEI